MRYYAMMESPLGKLFLVSDEESLKEIRFEENGKRFVPEADWREGGAINREATTQLGAFFAGTRKTFQLPLDADGTEFQQRVWSELQRIPYGATVSYGELARRLGRPKASRAVGAANGRNPLPIVIPCHRVIGSSGTLTGYGGGIRRKQYLLRLEGALL